MKGLVLQLIPTRDSVAPDGGEAGSRGLSLAGPLQTQLGWARKGCCYIRILLADAAPHAGLFGAVIQSFIWPEAGLVASCPIIPLVTCFSPKRNGAWSCYWCGGDFHVS